MAEMKPKNKVIIVTGASGQLGSEICKQFDENNTVIMSDLDFELCEKKIEELSLKNTIPLKLDVTNQDSIIIAMKEVVDKFGNIDILINNAGIAVFTPMEKRTFEEFDKVMKVNVYGTFFCTQEVLKYMELNNSGRIVNIASHYGIVSPDPRIYGDSGRNSSEVYGASKAGIIQMTKYMAVHVKSKNITVNSVSPGGIFNNQTDSFVKNYEDKTPLQRMATEDKIASGVVFLCSDAASYINGHNLIIDGGFSIW
jgi:3-oxoacyl-[acyl-carrier protein] reductase